MGRKGRERIRVGLKKRIGREQSDRGWERERSGRDRRLALPPTQQKFAEFSTHCKLQYDQ